MSAKRVETGHLLACPADPHAGESGLRVTRLGLPLIDTAASGDVDERECGAAVCGYECAVPGRREGRDPRAGKRGLHADKSTTELLPDSGRRDGRSFRKLDDGNDRGDIAAAAVDRSDLLIGLEAFTAGNAELLRERPAGGADRGERRDGDRGPEADDKTLVLKNPAG